MKILTVVGARPNFIKVAPLHHAFCRYPHVRSKIVHTGQHHAPKMSDIFIRQLGLPLPDYTLGINQGPPTQLTASIMLAFERILLHENPNQVVVVGDVTSTLACALAAAQTQVPVAHVEAGLRSFDRSMPEELNRIMTDAIADMHFVSEYSGIVNLKHEGIPTPKIHWVGNVMIDTLVRHKNNIDQSRILSRYNLNPQQYALVTVHRPANVDYRGRLLQLTQIILKTADHLNVIFPVHPRTQNNLKKFGLLPLLTTHPKVILAEPLGYFDFVKLMKNAKLVITDSGGVQEETTYLGIPCFTLRQNTERPVTIEIGTNQLIPDLSPESVSDALENVMHGREKKGKIPPLWDGKTASRIATILIEGSH